MRLALVKAFGRHHSASELVKGNHAQTDGADQPSLTAVRDAVARFVDGHGRAPRPAHPGTPPRRDAGEAGCPDV